jgi:hypothetical protein
MRAWVSNKYFWEKLISDTLQEILHNVDFASRWDDAHFVWKPTLKGFDQLERLLACNGIVNHLMHNNFLTMKDNLAHTLTKHSKQHLAPSTHTLKNPHRPFDLALQTEHMMTQGNQSLIAKPATAFEGRGIIVASSPQRMMQQLQDFRVPDRMVVQELLPPCLHHGKKFDLRALVLVDQRKRVFMYSSVSARIAREKYSIDIHRSVVTNVTEGSGVVFLEELDVPSDMHQRIKDIVSQLFSKQIVDELAGEYCDCTYEVFGLDFQLTPYNALYLLEVNENPGLQCGVNDAVDADRRFAIREMLQIVLNQRGTITRWEQVHN